MKSKLIFLITLIAVLTICALIYISETADTELKNNQSHTRPSSINFIINNMNLIIHDDNGVAKAKLVTSEVKHQADNKVTNLKKPKLYFNQDNASWYITAKTGVITHNQNKVKQIDSIELLEGVDIIRNNFLSTKIPFINMKTESIIYYPEKDLIITNDKVLISTKGSQTTAIGLELNKTTQNLILTKNVQSVYQPSSFTKINLDKDKTTKIDAKD